MCRVDSLLESYWPCGEKETQQVTATLHMFILKGPDSNLDRHPLKKELSIPRKSISAPNGKHTAWLPSALGREREPLLLGLTFPKRNPASKTGVYGWSPPNNHYRPFVGAKPRANSPANSASRGLFGLGEGLSGLAMNGRTARIWRSKLLALQTLKVRPGVQRQKLI